MSYDENMPLIAMLASGTMDITIVLSLFYVLLQPNANIKDVKLMTYEIRTKLMSYKIEPN